METDTTIVLADAHTMMRDGLKLVLQETGRMRVVGEADCAVEAVRLSRLRSPDILVINLALLGGSGLRAIGKLIAAEPGTNVLALTDSEHEEALDGLLEAGVRGCIGRDRMAEDLVIAVDLVAVGRMRLPRQASRLVRRRIMNHGSGLEARLARLNEKDREILALTARGLAAREIGARTRLAAKSVYNCRSRIMRELGCDTRAELVAIAVEAGMLERDSSPSTP